LPEARLDALSGTYSLAGPFGFALGLVVFRSNPQGCVTSRSAALLLHDVRKFVRQHPAPGGALQCVGLRAEDEILTNCVRHRADGLRGLSGARAGVHTNLAEIVPEAWFHEGAHGWVKRLAGRAQYFMHDGGNSAGATPAIGEAL